MGNELFGENVAGELAAELGPLLLPFRLLKKQVGSRTSGNLAAGKPVTFRPFSCRGILETYQGSRFGETNIIRGTRVALILGDTLPNGVVPEPGDRLIAEGSTFDITAPIERDPDAATYTCPITD